MCTSDIGEKYCRKYRSLSLCFIFYVKDNSRNDMNTTEQLFILFSDFDAEIVQWNKGVATQRGSRNTEGDQRASIQIKVKVADI